MIQIFLQNRLFREVHISNLSCFDGHQIRHCEDMGQIVSKYAHG